MSASPRLPSDLALPVLDQAATKSDVGAVDPNGDIVTGVAGAGVKYLERAKVGRGCWFDPAIGGESQAVLRRNHPLLRGKLVRQRIGISRNPAACSASIPPILS